MSSIVVPSNVPVPLETERVSGKDASSPEDGVVAEIVLNFHDGLDPERHAGGRIAWLRRKQQAGRLRGGQVEGAAGRGCQSAAGGGQRVAAARRSIDNAR